MAKPNSSYRDFADRLRHGERLAGTFVKTPTSHATEMLGAIGFDFAVFDMEHAPIDLGALDMMLLAARAANIASVVRVAEGSAAAILSALDAGASGVLVPHVSSRAKAEEIVAHCRFGKGRRGFANTTRAGAFGAAGFREHMERQDRETACIAMIEDLEAVDRIDEILAVDGLDAIFVGRGDLTAALGENTMNCEATMQVVRPIMQAARHAEMPAMALCIDRRDAQAMAALGATAFMMGSDHGFMQKAAREALAALAPPIASKD